MEPLSHINYANVVWAQNFKAFKKMIFIFQKNDPENY